MYVIIGFKRIEKGQVTVSNNRIFKVLDRQGMYDLFPEYTCRKALAKGLNTTPANVGECYRDFRYKVCSFWFDVLLTAHEDSATPRNEMIKLSSGIFPLVPFDRVKELQIRLSGQMLSFPYEWVDAYSALWMGIIANFDRIEFEIIDDQKFAIELQNIGLQEEAWFLIRL